MEVLPTEITIRIFELSRNPKVVLVSKAFAGLKDLYFGTNFTDKRLISLCKEKDFRALNPCFKKVFSHSHFMVCFNNEFDEMVEQFSFSYGFPSFDDPKKRRDFILFYNRWSGRKNLTECTGFSNFDKKDCLDAFYFGMGENGHNLDWNNLAFHVRRYNGNRFIIFYWWGKHQSIECNKSAILSFLRESKMSMHSLMNLFGVFGKVDHAIELLGLKEWENYETTVQRLIQYFKYGCYRAGNNNYFDELEKKLVGFPKLVFENMGKYSHVPVYDDNGIVDSLVMRVFLGLE